MTRRPRIECRALVGLLALVVFASGPGFAAAPNILLVVADDLGYADVGFHGASDLTTPNLDALARSGVRCTNGYVSGPYCSPTRAGLLTGRYQTRFGHEFNPDPPGAGLPVAEQTLPQRLRAAGYATGVIGKWHLGIESEFHPLRRGCDEFFGFLPGAHSYFDPDGIVRGTEPVAAIDYTTDAFAREAVGFIGRHRARPWFLFLSFNAVHTPMHATPERLAACAHVEDAGRRAYAAMVLALDEAVGTVVDAVAKNGGDRPTLVIFLSDNGGPSMPNTTLNQARNDPLRGGKRTTLEGGIRVPFVISWPGTLAPGVYDRPVIQLDVAATALAAAGVEAELDGVDLVPFVTGARTGDPHEALYWRFGRQMAIRVGDHKLVRYDGNADTGTGAFNQPVVGPKLYDLANDVGERRDLAAEMPARVAELQARWDAWNAGNIPPAWPAAHEWEDR